MITREKTQEITERIASLRERVLSAKPGVCTERARFYTEVYKENEDQPVIIKRALALKKTLEKMTIFIDVGELIVGNQSSAHRAAPIFPEYAVDWLPEEMDELDKRPGDAFYITEEHKQELTRIARWWKGKVLWDRGRALMSQELRDLQDSAIIKATGNLTSGDAHIAVDFYKILEVGLSGYFKEIEEHHRLVDRSDREGVKKDSFYNALTMGLKSFQTFIRRYRDLAIYLSKESKDPRREKASDHCRQLRCDCRKAPTGLLSGPPAGVFCAADTSDRKQRPFSFPGPARSVPLPLLSKGSEGG